MNTPTMQAVANRLGISKSTVSLSMRNDPRIAPETRAKVQRTAHTMGYRANPVVCSLMSNLRIGRDRDTAYGVALVVPAGCEPTREFLAGLNERLAMSGRKTELFRLADVSAERLCVILKARGIDGSLVIDSEHACAALAQAGQYCVRFSGKPETHEQGFLCGIVLADQLAYHRQAVLQLT